jgi:hypothetical protein
MKVRHIYGSALGDLHAATADTTQAIQLFNALNRPLRVAKLTEIDMVIVTMYQASIKEGVVFSFPSSLIAKVCPGGSDSAAPSPALLEIQEVFEVDVQAPVEDEIAGYVFAVVSKSRQNIVLAAGSSAPTPYRIRCDRLEVVGARDGHAVLERCGQLLDLDFSDWCKGDLCLQLLRGLKLWSSVGSFAALAPKRRRLEDVVASNASRVGAFPLSMDEVSPLALLTGGDNVEVSYVHDHRDEAQTVFAQEQALLALADVSVRQDDFDLPDLAALPGVYHESLVQLSHRGLVDFVDDDFGEQRFALVFSSSEFRSRMTFAFQSGVPARAMAAEAVHPGMSKLALFAICVGRGWRFGAGLGELRRESPKFIASTAIFGVHWFWVVLAAIDLIWAKGFTVVYTGGLAKYYEYLFFATSSSELNKYGS